MRTLHLLRDPVPGEPPLDAGVSRALLELVAERRVPETFRLYRPDDILAFSGLDAASPGFETAVAAARRVGFSPVLRLAGGRAALFHRDTLAFAWSMPTDELREGIGERFDALADLIVTTLTRLGVDARVGEVAGEYCPGSHSVNARGERKLMGVGQRVIRGAAHVGGVIVVRRAERVREGLEPVYRALDLTWRPETAGSIEDEIGAVDCDTVADALCAALSERFDLREAPSDLFATALARAGDFAPRFRIGASPVSRRIPTAAKLAVESC